MKPIRKTRPCPDQRVGSLRFGPPDHDRRRRFLCRGCKTWVCGICEGCADELPDHCDRCWCRWDRRRVRRFLPRAFVGLASIPIRGEITRARLRFTI